MKAEGRESLRWAALDELRGTAVFLMLPVNAAMEFANIPAWFKHAPGTGMTMADFIMPVFLFALGLSSSFSLKKRLAAQGFARTAAHALLRSGLLFLFGTIGFFLVWEGRSWEILQMLGATSALAFPFIFLPPHLRIAAALAILGGVEAARTTLFEAAYRAWYASGIGGPAGTIALAAIPIGASALGELARALPPARRIRAAAGTGALLLATGLCLSPFQPPDKHLLTASYLLIATGTASLALAAFEPISLAFVRLFGDRVPPLIGALGRNPILAYMGGGILTLALRALVGAEAPAAIAWVSSFGVLAIVAAICLFLDRANIRLKL